VSDLEKKQRKIASRNFLSLGKALACHGLLQKYSKSWAFCSSDSEGLAERVFDAFMAAKVSDDIAEAGVAFSLQVVEFPPYAQAHWVWPKENQKPQHHYTNAWQRIWTLTQHDEGQIEGSVHVIYYYIISLAHDLNHSHSTHGPLHRPNSFCFPLRIVSFFSHCHYTPI